MLGRKHRISLAKFSKFDAKVVVDNLILQVSLKSRETPKFAIVVPSKFCKKAVGRNRTKRLVWQSLGVLKDRVRPGIYKILVKGDFSQLKLRQVLPKIEKLFILANLIK